MSKLEIRKTGITDTDARAVVNAANRWLQAGGGVCGYIFQAAGHQELQEACDRIGGCPTGSAVITPGFRLCEYIIHAVGPQYQDGKHGEEKQLYSCYQKALDLVRENGLHSVAFPLISSGIYGYPIREAWQTALKACRDWLSAHEDYEVDIIFAVLKDEIMAEGLKILQES